MPAENEDGKVLDDGEEVLRLFMMTQDLQSPQDNSDKDRPREQSDFLFPENGKDMDKDRKAALNKFDAFFKKLENL